MFAQQSKGKPKIVQGLEQKGIRSVVRNRVSPCSRRREDHSARTSVCSALAALCAVSLTISGTLPPTDSFGIQKIYADAAPPIDNWTFDGNPDDWRFMEQHFHAAGDGWFQPMDCSMLRFQVLSDVSANEKTIRTFDESKVLAKGYLFKPPDSPDNKGDFLNIEQTWRFRVMAIGHDDKNGGPHIELVRGSYKHSSANRFVGQDKAVPQVVRR